MVGDGGIHLEKTRTYEIFVCESHRSLASLLKVEGFKVCCETQIAIGLALATFGLETWQSPLKLFSTDLAFGTSR